MLVWYLGLGVGLLYGGGCLLEHAHLFGGNMVLTVDLLSILRLTAASSDDHVNNSLNNKEHLIHFISLFYDVLTRQEMLNL